MRQLSFALRRLIRSKGYALVTVATLAIAIGVNTAMFGVLYAVLLRSLPYPEPSRLMEAGRAFGSGVESVTYPVYERWRDHARSFASVGVYVQNTGVSRVTLTSGDEPEAARAAFVSASFFETMGVAPRLGRVFTRAEEDSREPVAVVSGRTWQRRFADAQSIEGRVLHINGLAFRVIGVMPGEFAWPSRESVAWIPITHNREWPRRAGPVPLFRVVGRLAPGSTRSVAGSELQSMFDQPDATAAVVPLRPPLAGNHVRALYLLTGAVGFVLLIACANIAGLTLARGAKGAGELAIRMALGAGRARVALEMFAESLLLAVAGAAGGLLVGGFAIDLLIRFRPASVERMDEAGLSGGVLLFSVLAALASATLFGLLPAWQLSGRDPVESLRGQGRGSAGGRRLSILRRVLVAGQLALTVILLAGAGLMVRSLAAAQKVDLGFDAANALFFRVQFPDTMPLERQTEYFRTLFQRLGSMPQVKAVGAVRDMFELSTPGALGLRAIEGRAPEPRGAWTPLTWTTVAGSYSEAMGADLVRGRWFRDTDGPGSPRVAVIDESTARRYWPGEDPVGRRFRGQDQRGPNDEWLTVIGVIRNMRRQRVDREPTAHVYEWYRQTDSVPRDVVVRINAPVAAEIRAVARSLDASVILSAVRTVESEVDDQLTTRRFQTALLSTFAAIAFVLAAIGVYGLVSYSVSLRLREFGIRAALGEPRSALRTRVVRESLATALAGIVPGLLGAMLLSGVVRSLVFGVSALDAISLGGACALLAATAVAAACIPAIRASRVDPVVALRDE